MTNELFLYIVFITSGWMMSTDSFGLTASTGFNCTAVSIWKRYYLFSRHLSTSPPFMASIFWATHSHTLISQQAHSHWDRIRDLSPTLSDHLGYFFVCVGMCLYMGVWAYAFVRPAMWPPIWIFYHQNEGILTKWGWSTLLCTPSKRCPEDLGQIINLNNLERSCLRVE